MDSLAIAPADPAAAIRKLLELIAALDRRVPQVQRAGEIAIARDAAALRDLAVRRIEALGYRHEGAIVSTESTPR